MAALKKLIAVALIALSVVVAVHFIFSPFYADAVDVGLVWDILNYFMAAAAITLMVVHYQRKREFDARGSNGSITREYLEVNLAAYGAILLAIFFLWNWFDNLFVGGGFAFVTDEPQSDTRLIFWGLLDPLLVIAYGTTGCHLLRNSARG